MYTFIYLELLFFLIFFLELAILSLIHRNEKKQPHTTC
jgi:hypothetical protein